MIANGNSQPVGAERFMVVFIMSGVFFIVAGCMNLILGIALVWPVAIVGAILLTVGIVLLVLGIRLYKRVKARMQEAVANPQQATPTVVGYNPANYGTATAPESHYPPQGQPNFPQGQTGPNCYDPPDKGNFGPIEPSAPPSYGEATSTK